MDLTSRVTNAVKAFINRNQTVKNSLPNEAADFLRFGNKNKPIYQGWSQVEMSDRDMYKNYPYAAFDKRANRGATLGKNYLFTKASPAIMDAAKTKGVDVVHPYLPLISESLEFSETEFWYGISTYLDLEGVYYLMAVRAIGKNQDQTTKVGAVQKFVLMNPYNVHRVVNANGELGGYLESVPGRGYREIPKEMVIEIRKLNPFNNEEPYALADAAKESQFTMMQAGDYARHSIKGNINAPGAITTDIELDDHIFDNFVSRIQNHTKGEPLYGNGTGSVNWESMQIDLDKAALDKINDIHRAAFFAVAGVSDIMMGQQKAGTGRETSKTQKDDFTENAVMPQIEKIIDSLNLDYRKWYTDEWKNNKYEIALDNPLESDREAELKDIEIRQSEHDMVVELVNMGYEFELAAKYAHGDISLLELGEPTLEPELTDQQAAMQAAASLGLPIPNDQQDPNDPNQTIDSPNKSQVPTTNSVTRTNNNTGISRTFNLLTAVKFVDPKENEKKLKTALAEAKKLKKKQDDEEKAAKKQAKTKPVIDDKPQDGKDIKDEKTPTVKVEVVTPNAVDKVLKASNQIASRDFPDLYEDINVNWSGNMDDLGCIMMDTEKIPVAQYIKNPDEDIFDKPGWGGGLAGETEAHVTLLFGLLENGNIWKNKVDSLLEGWKMPEVTIDEVSYFDLGDSFAIVGLVRQSPEIIDAHERLSLLPHLNTFSEYHPHITLAYIKHDVDPNKWVKPLAKKYNGQKVATTSLNYGSTPEEVEDKKESKAEETSNNNFEAQQAALKPVAIVHNCDDHAFTTNTTLVKAKNALEPDTRDRVILQEANLYTAVSNQEKNIVNQVILDVRAGKYDEAADLLTKAQKNEHVSELTAVLTSFFVILFPIYANQLMQARASQFGKQGFFSMDNGVNDFIDESAKKSAESHVNTVIEDLTLAARNAFHDAAEDALITLVEEAANKRSEDILSRLPTNPNHEDIVKAVKQGKFDDDPIYKRARELAREGNGLDAITRALKKEYDQISKNRARTIARHETNRVFNMAQYQADLQFLKESGLIQNAYKRLYNRANDPCPFCAKLIEESRKNPIPFTENFVDLGESLTASFPLKNGKLSARTLTMNYEAIIAGNIHVNCRCEYELVIKREDGTFMNDIDVRVINTLGYNVNTGGNPNHDSLGRFSTGGFEGFVKRNYAKQATWTDKESTAIQDYTSKGYKTINKYTRGQSGFIVDEHVESTVKLLESSMKNTLKAPATLYRGFVTSADITPGMKINDKAFVSTTFSSDIAQDFAKGDAAYYNDDRRPIVLKIKAKKGQKGLMPLAENIASNRPLPGGSLGLRLNEEEYILPRDTTFKVTKVTEKVDYEEAEVEIV